MAWRPGSIGNAPFFEGRQPVRENAARAFQLLGRRAEDGLAELLIALKDTDEGVRAAAAESLAVLKLDADQVIPALAELLLGRSRRTAERALGAIVAYGGAAVAPLLAGLADRPQRAVPVLTRVAQRLPNELLTPLAGKLARTESPTVRENAVDVLGQLGKDAQGATPALLAAIRDDLDLDFRVKAIAALANVAILDDEVKTVLAAVRATDLRFSVQNAIANALNALGARKR